jgi:hypothetical protein
VTTVVKLVIFVSTHKFTQGSQHQAALDIIEEEDPKRTLTWGEKLFVVFQTEAQIMFGTPAMTQRPKQH